MKKLLFGLTFLLLSAFSSQVFAKLTATDVCIERTGPRTLVACQNAISGNRYQPEILAFIENSTAHDNTVSCLRITANKEYDIGAIQICMNLYHSDAVECIKNAENVPIDVSDDSDIHIINLAPSPVSYTPGKYTIRAEGVDGMTHVSCFNGTISSARNNAFSQIYEKCKSMGGKLVEGSFHDLSTSCGPSGTMIIICPNVCKVNAEATCLVER